jgi:hypothetical protein
MLCDYKGTARDQIDLRVTTTSPFELAGYVQVNSLLVRV